MNHMKCLHLNSDDNLELYTILFLLFFNPRHLYALTPIYFKHILRLQFDLVLNVITLFHKA